MTNHKENLKNIIEQRKNVIEEINRLSDELEERKEQAIKYQGIIEYLKCFIEDAS